MVLKPEAVSGPVGDAGKGNDLSDAINAAIGSSESKSAAPVVGETPAPKVPAKVKAEAKTDIAGDESASEDAPDTEAHEADTPTEADEQSSKPSIEAPRHWPEDRKAAFAKLPEEGQQAMLKLAKDLEGGFTRKSQELSDQAKYATTVRSLFNDSDRAQLQQAGTDEVGVIRYLLGVQRFATQQPKEYVKWAMQNLGVKPEDLGFPNGTANPAQAQPAADPLADLLADPQVKNLEAKLAVIEQSLQRQTQEKQQAAQRQAQEAEQNIGREIANFRTAQDDHGQLAYPHFDEVHVHMGALMEADPTLAKMPDGPEKLKAAYDMAVWARPDLRNSLIETEANRKALDMQKKRDAERARKAVGVKPAAGVVSSPRKTNSLDDALDASFSKLGF
jgi:hypothetical protein